MPCRSSSRRSTGSTSTSSTSAPVIRMRCRSSSPTAGRDPSSSSSRSLVRSPTRPPTADAREDAFDVVIPSMPGYGFSGKPTGTGWNPDRIARAWAELMKRLGYTRYVAQGGDWGSPISSAMARQAPAGLLGIHINLPATVPPEVAAVLAGGGPAPAGLSAKERAAFDSLDAFYKMRRAYAADDGHAAASDRPGADGLSRGACGLHVRLQRRRARALARQRRFPGQRHAVLADEQRHLVGAAVLGNQRPKRASSRPRRRPPRSRCRWPSRYFRTRSIEPRKHGRGAPIAT